MDLKEMIRNFAELLKKYRYAVIILLIGIVLMLLPSVDSMPMQESEPTVNTGSSQTVEEQLSDLLSKIQGAGRVEVMLSHASGAETQYHMDTHHESESDRSTTVIVTDGQRTESALVTRVDPPEYLGAIILCQGADSASIRLAIVDAVSKYTGLGADQIAVLKMK